jgi:hypothetical protein
MGGGGESKRLTYDGTILFYARNITATRIRVIAYLSCAWYLFSVEVLDVFTHSIRLGKRLDYIRYTDTLNMEICYYNVTRATRTLRRH